MLALFVAAILSGAVPVTPAGFIDAREAQVAIDADHRVYVAYGLREAVYLSVSRNEGATYESPIKVAEAGKLSLGRRRGPRITVHNGVVTITATYGKQGGGGDGDIFAFRSPDGGKSWTPPVRVNDVGGAAREGLHAMAAGPDGTIACAWLDLRAKGTTLYLATSHDGGANWSPNRLVYTSPSGSICECCHPSLAFDLKGKLFVMFRNSVAGARNMYLTSSADDGRTFAPAAELGKGTWVLDACPMDGGSLTVTATGEVETIWRREATLYRSGSAGSERLFAEGRQGWVTTGLGGAYLVWSDGRRVLASTPTERVAELTNDGEDAVAAASPDGKLVVAAWTQDGIRVVRLR